MKAVQHIKFFKNSSFVFFPTQLSHLPFPPHPCFLQRSLSETHHTLVFFRAWSQSHQSLCQSWRRMWDDHIWAPEEGHFGFWQGINYRVRTDFFLMCQLQLEEWPEWWITLVRLSTGARFTQVRVSSTRRDRWHFVLPGRHAVHATGLVS